jgi:hypothetical protein
MKSILHEIADGGDRRFVRGLSLEDDHDVHIFRFALPRGEVLLELLQDAMTIDEAAGLRRRVSRSGASRSKRLLGNFSGYGHSDRLAYRHPTSLPPHAAAY